MSSLTRLRNQRGDFNIVTAALTLPILILLVTVSFEVLRIPITRQHVYSILHSASQSVTHETSAMDAAAFDYKYDMTTGINWCLFQSSNHPSYACPADGSYLDGELRPDGGTDLKAILNSIATQLSTYSFSILRIPSENFTVKAAIYAVESDDSGMMTNQVAIIDTNSTMGTLGYSIDLYNQLKTAILSSASPSPNHLLLPAALGEKRVATAYIVLGAAVRIKNIFNLPEGLTFGSTPVGGGEKQTNETTLTVTVIRPLPRNMRLTGPASNIPPTS